MALLYGIRRVLITPSKGGVQANVLRSPITGLVLTSPISGQVMTSPVGA